MQLRIGNQRKLDQLMRKVGLGVQESLMTQFDKQVSELNNEVDKFELEIKDWEVEMMHELGENKIAVQHFNSDVSNCLETMSKNMNAKYSLTTDYHAKVRESMDNLEKQVYKPADTSKNFMPHALQSGEKIISAMQGEQVEQEPTQVEG